MAAAASQPWLSSSTTTTLTGRHTIITLSRFFFLDGNRRSRWWRPVWPPGRKRAVLRAARWWAIVGSILVVVYQLLFSSSLLEHPNLEQSNAMMLPNIKVISQNNYNSVDNNDDELIYQKQPVENIVLTIQDDTFFARPRRPLPDEPLAIDNTHTLDARHDDAEIVTAPRPWRNRSLPPTSDATLAPLPLTEYNAVLNQTYAHEPQCRGKHHLLRQFLAAGIKLPPSQCTQLPLWSDVVQLYGPGPVVLGLETCALYRQKLSHGQYPPRPLIAGLWNSGTTALSRTFLRRLRTFSPRAPLHTATVDWGKHTPYYLKDSVTYPILKNRNAEERRNEVLRKEYSLPIVMVRDPFRWMTSMCRKPYSAKWQRGWNGRCPNLLPTRKEQERLGVERTFPVITSPKQANYRRTKYASLADVWSTFYEEYWFSDAPRLIIRAEDTIFHPHQLLSIIANCSGLSLRLNHFDQVLFTAQSYQQQKESNTNWLTAMIQYGRDQHRYGTTYTAEEKRYLQTALSPALVKLLRYPQIPVEEY